MKKTSVSIAYLQLCLYAAFIVLLGGSSLYNPMIAAVSNFFAVKTIYVMVDANLYGDSLWWLASKFLLAAWVVQALMFESVVVALSIALLIEVWLYQYIYEEKPVWVSKGMCVLALLNPRLAPYVVGVLTIESRATALVDFAEASKVSASSALLNILALPNKAAQACFQLIGI